MPSPFPGMNPYLEHAALWRSFHAHFIPAAKVFLAPQVRPQYWVDIETQLYIHEPPAERRLRGVADIAVREYGPAAPRGVGAGAAVADPPVYVTLPEEVEIEKVHSLVIRDKVGNQVVTVIKLLSPTNKYAGDDREYYLRKRAELLRARANFVELDLLRGGPRMPPDEMPASTYCAVVSRVEERPKVAVWPWNLRDPMPVVPIPLRPGEPDATLDLKAVLDRVYDEGYYGDTAYQYPPEPRLSPDDAAWAAQFVPAPQA